LTGIIFPNVMGTLGPIMQMEQAEKRNAFEMDRIRRQDALDAEDREAGSHFGAALQGDPAAVAKVSANPKFAVPLAQHLQRMDAGQRAKLKEQFEVTGKTAAGILALPETEQPAAYEAAFQNLTAQGYKINLPPKWSPALKNQLQGYAIQVPEYLKMLGDRPAPMGGAPGSFTAQVSTDESGGNYNIPNAKGSGAYGKYQFMPETWASVAQANPQLNLPMNMRQATPQQQEAAMEAFTRSNGQALQQAGVPPTSANLYLAHRFGVGGATKFLSAPDDAPIATLFPPIWIQQNPDLNTTVGQFKRSVQSRYGGIPAGREVATGGNAAPMPGGSGIAQGDAQPRADASGNPVQPAGGGDPEVFELKSWLSKAMPGARPMGVKGKPVRDSQGLLMILKPDGTTGWVEVPKQAPTPPIGYRAAPGGGLEPIPGGPADPVQAKAIAEAKRRADEKVTPATVAKGMQENLTAIKKIDSALSALDEPQAKGSVGGVGGTVGAWMPGGSEFLNWVDKDGAKVRALIADIGSLKIHDRSGAAVTAAETPRLKPFVPSVGDSPDVIRTKLNNFRVEYEGMLRDSLEFYSEQNGFKPYTPALDYLNRQQVPAAAPTAPAPSVQAPASPGPAPQSAPQAAPAPAPAAPAIAEGATATNPQTGERIIFRGGQWMPTK
jgi:hypothetical protein